MGFASKPMRAYADYILMEEWDPVPIPEGVSDEAAALCEPCAIAVRATRRSDLKLGDSVMVLGGGPIGLFCLQTARAAGATSVYLSEPAPVRREAALALGADAVIDPNQGDVVEQALALTGRLGPDVVFDCAGWQRTLDQSLSMVRRNGQVVLVAIAWEDIPVLPIDWMGREIRLQTTFGSVADDWRVALDLMKTGRIDVEPLLSDNSFVPLESIDETFNALIKPTNQLQMVIRM
jgi:(R,R)-butanediol dehydrogenase/meso-butanediol dehydrogenase/diacetyl reductase